MKAEIHYYLQQLKMKNGEHEQVLIRVVICFFIWLYALFHQFTDTSLALVYASEAYAWGLFLITLQAANTSRLRQWVAMFMDLGFVTAVMLVTRVEGVAFFWIYLWVIFGNGLRYGQRPLIAGYAFSLAGLASVYLFNNYWQEQKIVMLGMALTLVLVPIYGLKLILQLNKAIDRANSSDKSKSYLLAIMNHELRTPLNGIVGASRLLSETQLSESQQGLINILEKSSAILSSIIDHMLAFTKSEAEQSKLLVNGSRFSLDESLRNTVGIFEAQAKDKGVSLSFEYVTDVPDGLIGDSVGMQQVLINTLGNSVKFTKAGGSVKLQVSTVLQNIYEARIRFTVIDTGIGMLPEEKAKLFRRFQQANEGIARTFGGSGLGLSIARDLVNAMNGTISLESKPNNGTLIWFEIPFHKAMGSANINKKTSGDNRMLVISLGVEEVDCATLREYLSSWEIGFERTETIHQIINKLQAVNGPQVSLLCAPGKVGVDPVYFLKHIKSAAEGKVERAILVDPDGVYSEAQARAMGYSSVLSNSTDKSKLFTALRSQRIEDSAGVVTVLHREPKKVILIADDNRVNRMITSKMLENAGYQTVMAEDGDDALDQLEVLRADLLVLDMKMPSMDGTEVMRIYRGLARSSETPVIILTANATIDAKQECMRAGADAFLTKPVDQEQLLQTVAKLLQAKKPPSGPTDDGLADSHRYQPSGKLINETTLHGLDKLGDGQSNFTEEVVLGFIDEMQGVLGKMELALSNREFTNFKTLAYSIQGGASNVGAESLFSISNDVTRMDPRLIETSGKKMLSVLKDCFLLTQAEMLRYLRNSNPSASGPQLTP